MTTAVDNWPAAARLAAVASAGHLPTAPTPLGGTRPDDNPLPEETKQNLIKLSQFVTQTTMAQGVELPAEVLDTFININLQISEGLLEAQPKA